MQQAVLASASLHQKAQVLSLKPGNDGACDSGMRVALVHDWCPHFRGGERVLARLCKLFPGADVFTLFDFLPDSVKQEHFPGVRFETSVANRLPYVQKYYRALFSLCPFLIEQFDVTRYDLVISSSAAFARGVLTRPDQPHLSYVHSPVRYAWDEQFSYLEQGGLKFGPKGLLYRWMLHRLRMWDARTAHGPDMMVANSSFIQARIRRVYGRNADVVFPPVALDELPFQPIKDDYYITASFLAPYKRTDLVIKAFRAMPHRRLLVIGDGQQSAKLRELAAPNIEFTGFMPRDAYVDTLARARAMVFAGCEDFGIALAEAQACGTPLIAFGRGGAVDIVRRPETSSEPTGILFSRQSEESIIDAIERFELSGQRIRPDTCRTNAERFSEERFDAGILAAVAKVQAIAAGAGSGAVGETASIAAMHSR